MQSSLLELLRCCQSYAKIVQTECKMSNLLGNFAEVLPILCKDTKKAYIYRYENAKTFQNKQFVNKNKSLCFFHFVLRSPCIIIFASPR